MTDPLEIAPFEDDVNGQEPPDRPRNRSRNQPIGGMVRLFGTLFGCKHRNISRVFNLGDGDYIVCLDGCGKRYRYDWRTMKVGPEL